MGRLLSTGLRRSLGGGRGHHGRVEGHVRRRWEPEAVDARADAHEVGFVRPMSCPPSRTAIAAPFFVFRTRKATRAIITIIRGHLRVFSPREILFAPPRLSPWRPSPPLLARVRVRVRAVCSEESRLFRRHFRIREGHDQTRGKNSGKQILMTLPGNFGA